MIQQSVPAFRNVFARRLLPFCAQLKPSGTNTTLSESDLFEWYQTLWFSNFWGKVLDSFAENSALAGAFPQRTCTPSLSPFLSSPWFAPRQKTHAQKFQAPLVPVCNRRVRVGAWNFLVRVLLPGLALKLRAESATTADRMGAITQEDMYEQA